MRKNKTINNNLSGKKVKINVEAIKARGGTSKKFVEFLEKNKDNIFTAMLDICNGYTIMYELLEDESDVKWLFWEEDLIIVE